MLAQLPARAACRRIGRRSSARRAFLTLPDMYRSVISSDLAGVDVDRVAKAAIPLQDLRRDDFALVRQAIGQARVVLMGEETHGTEEFYQLRSDLTKALIDREGFTAVLCEADFPAFYELNRFVGGAPPFRDLHKQMSEKEGPTIEQAMEKLKARFPVWMWRNHVLKGLAEWMRQHNAGRPAGSRPVMLLGLDIYSMFDSAHEVIAYLDQVDTDLGNMARRQYGALGTFRPEAADYCRAIYTGKIASQAPQVARMLATLYENRMKCLDVPGDGDEYFAALQNARVVGEAEEYYRNSYMGGNVTWNIRDSAMVKMIAETLAFQEDKGEGRPARVLVWAHNSHVGDAMATEHHEQRQHNIGRLVRQQFGYDDSFIIGFSTYTGTVRAARQWNGKDFVMDLNESLPLSAGALLHRAGQRAKTNDFAVLTRTNDREHPLSDEQQAARDALCAERLERFVGVQYIKRTERQSHYAYCRMGEQFDLIIHVDTTSAVKPWFPKPTTTSSPRPGTIDYSRFENFEESAGSDDEVPSSGAYP
ncbi:Erythromycin esterase [Plasmodiophora brassicae]